LERSINSRFYLDYNATSPLSIKVKDFLRNGDFLFGNPSSIHSTGKHSKKYITDTVDFLFATFKLSPDDYHLYFHSGATEGINIFFKGNALLDFKNGNKSLFVFGKTDHQAVVSQAEDLEALGHKVFFFEVDSEGLFDLEKLIQTLQVEKSEYKKIYMNYTVVNNETGVVWDLGDAVKIQERVGAIIHVDAVQLPGKIYSWTNLSNKLDTYVFSAHKFGAMKGVGFSFLKKTSSFYPLITGGSQQDSLRSGTLNALGIYSVKLALEDLILNQNLDRVFNYKKELILYLESNFSDKIQIIAKNVKNTNLNTVFFIVKGQKPESISLKFDLEKIDVATGSACSSGIIKENRILLSMGYPKELSRNVIRISFGPTQSFEDFSQVLKLIKKVLA
jgi:cysteine desulfurase